MSTNPGLPAGFANGRGRAGQRPDRQREDRPLTDHTFVGPGYPISHPGLFPFRLEESPFTPQQWLKFDYRAKWGSDDFESKVAAAPGSYTFPPEWQNAADRKTGLAASSRRISSGGRSGKELRMKLLETASHLDGPFFKGTPARSARRCPFEYKITNRNKGHNLPSGSLGAQPELWLNVALIDPDGKRVWESGYVDSHGDVADLQSEDVQEGKIPHDDQLVSMQAKFITTNVKGTDREMYLPINLDFDQLPFIRPGGTPTSLLNHPPFARMEKRSIPPLGTRVAKYKVPGKLLTKPGTYRLAVRLRGRTEPIYFMKFVGATQRHDPGREPMGRRHRIPTPSNSRSAERGANMNGKTWTANPLLLGLLLLALGAPCAFAAADEPEAEPPRARARDVTRGQDARRSRASRAPADGWFKPDPTTTTSPTTPRPNWTSTARST